MLINQFKAVIFDMDGIIINSEPFWKASEEAVFQELGINLSFDDIAKNVGLKNTEVVDNLCLQFNIQTPIQSIICERLEQRVIDFIQSNGEAIDGLYILLDKLMALKIPMAIATSSSHLIIEAVCSKLKLYDYFQIISSAYNEEYGKPHPAVYITTAMKLNLDSRNCLVIEDSINGVLAGKAAKMHVIAMPESHNFNNLKYGIADKKCANFVEIEKYLFS